jgi:putative transposase
MTRLDLKLGDRLLHHGTDFVFEGRRNQELDFISPRTGERLVYTDAELAISIGNGTCIMVQCHMPPNQTGLARHRALAAFSMRSSADKERARLRTGYVADALAEGLVGRTSDAALRGSIERTASRFGDLSPPSTRSLRRWLARGGRNPSAAFLTDNNAAKGNRNERLNADVRDVIESRIDSDYMARPPISIAELHVRIQSDVLRLNETRPRPLKVPCYGAVRNAVRRRSPRDLDAARYGAAVADRKYRRVNKQPRPEAPLDVVELDHTWSDLFVVCDKTWLPIGRPTIALAADQATGAPWGLYLGFEPPSLHTVMQCMRNGMLPKAYLDELVQRGEWRIKHRWEVFGRPRSLLVDRAAENISHDLEELCGAVGFHVGINPGRSPWYKGKIERALGKLNRQLLHAQRGTTFSNFLHRQDYDSEKNAVITFSELNYIVHRWIVDVLLWGPHSGISDAPACLWRDLCQRFPVSPLGDIAELDLLLGRRETRVLQRTGISYERITYVSDELVEMLSDPEFHKKSPTREVSFRYDPGDMDRIRVFDPRVNTYFFVSSDNPNYTKELSVYHHVQIKKFMDARMNSRADREGRHRR